MSKLQEVALLIRGAENYLQTKKEGLGYRKIAKMLNEENIKTPRGKTFFPSSVYSILKKKKIRNDRLNEHFKKKISKLRFEYFDS